MDFALFAGGFGENSPRAPYLPVLWKNRRSPRGSRVKLSRDEFRQEKPMTMAGGGSDANGQGSAGFSRVCNELSGFVLANGSV